MANKEYNQQDHSAIYNIKAVVTQTGLNPATIRAWERRYGLPLPQRSEGGHRQYSQHDIDTLKWLMARQEEGMSISHAVDLWQSLVSDGEDPLHQEEMPDGTARTVVPALGKEIDELREAWIAACLSFDRSGAEQVLTRAFSLFPPEVVCLELLQKALVEIGEGWHQGKVTIQQEHFTTNLSEQRLKILIAAAPAPTRPERIVVSAAPGERHTFGAYLLTYLLLRRGWDVVHLGADVPVQNFDATIRNLQPDLIIVSAQLLHTAAAIIDIARSVQDQETLLAFGGGAFNIYPQIREHIPGLFLGESLEDALETTATLLSTRPDLPEPPPRESGYQEAEEQFRERRSLIESHVWGAFIAANKPTQALDKLNSEMAMGITAALKLGDITLLGRESKDVQDALSSTHQSKRFIIDYLQAYSKGAKLHLGDAAGIIVNWLGDLVSG
jgi:methanogenic corrinoid protein MtbC1